MEGTVFNKRFAAIRHRGHVRHGGHLPGQSKSSSTLTQISFRMHGCSFASNEIAINRNAPLVYLANAIGALSKAID